jgi:hypothetical protein
MLDELIAKKALRLFPSVFIATIQTTMIKARHKAYSTKEAPCSSRTNLIGPDICTVCLESVGLYHDQSSG